MHLLIRLSPKSNLHYGASISLEGGFIMVGWVGGGVVLAALKRVYLHILYVGIKRFHSICSVNVPDTM